MTNSEVGHCMSLPYYLSAKPCISGGGGGGCLQGCTRSVRPLMTFEGNQNDSSHGRNTRLCEIYGYPWARNRLKSPKMAFD